MSLQLVLGQDIPVRDGDLILFPSSLQHGVKQRGGDKLYHLPNVQQFFEG